MSLYKNILVAVDLSRDSAILIEKALDLAKQYDAELSMVHIMEPIAVGYAVEVASIDLEELHRDAAQQSRTTLLEMGEKVGIPASRLHNSIGQPAREIRELAKNINTDLIVVGGHGRHGWELIFGSTASSISHGLECDLLTVYVPG